MLVSEAELITHLQQGQCGVYPTDTVPGMGALPNFAEQIYHLKQRDKHKPLVILAASIHEIQQLCATWEPEWERVINQHWPGALTLVLPAAPHIPRLLQQEGYVGLRIPNHPAALSLLRQTGPLATTSVNRAGEPALLTPESIHQSFPGLPLLAADYPEYGIPSTVLRWQAGLWEVLRQGSIRLS